MICIQVKEFLLKKTDKDIRGSFGRVKEMVKVFIIILMERFIRELG